MNFPLRYKALILDLDGTTVPSRGDGMPSERVKEAVNKAKKYLKVTVATGRPMFTAQKVLKELGLELPAVMNGGSEIVDLKTGKLLVKNYLNQSKQREIWKMCQAFNQPLYSDVDNYQNPIKNTNQITTESAKLWMGTVETAKALKFIEELNTIPRVVAHATSSWDVGDVVNIHISNEMGDKKHAIKKLLEILEVSNAETIGIGDHFNDLPLLESVGLKIVMGNAPDEIKAIADYVVHDLEHDGVAEAIEKFVLS